MGHATPHTKDPDNWGAQNSIRNHAEALYQIELSSRDTHPSDWSKPTLERFHPVIRCREVASATDDLRQRLANANDYFLRKAVEVFNDTAARELLLTMQQDIVVEISDFDAGKHGISLAKLTAANFMEVGAKVIHITEAGQRFIASSAQPEEVHR